MRHKFFIFILISLIALAGPFGRGALALEDAIIAIVNDEVITQKDLGKYLNAFYLQMIAEGRTEEEIKTVMERLKTDGLNQLIEDKLLVTEANEKGLILNEKVIDEKLATIRYQYESEELFLDALVADGFTITDLRNKITDSIKAKSIVDYEVRSKVFVNPQEVTEFYQYNADKFQKPERADFDSIFIAFDDNPQQAKARALEAFQLLRKGRDFASVAREFSQTPSIGMIPRGQLLPEIEEIIFSLEEGQISSLIELDNGVYIFKMKKKYPREVAPLEEVEEAINRIIFEQKFRERYLEWMQTLREKAYIEFKS